jgi:bifunctional DNase/RNase
MEVVMKCNVPVCGAEATFQFARIRSRRVIHQEQYCEAHAQEHIDGFRSDPFVGIASPYAVPGAVEVDLEMMVYQIDPHGSQGYVTLHEVAGTRSFCTIISTDAYHSLFAATGCYAPPRPFVHSAWVATIKELGGVVKDVIIDKESDEERWFDGRVRILKNECLVNIDVRASDAYILAVIAGVPIFAVERILAK